MSGLLRLQQLPDGGFWDRKVAGAVRVRSGEGEMKCWGFLEKGNRMESTRPVQSVLRFCGQRGWPDKLESGGSTGRARVSAPALPILPLPRIHGRSCTTPQYNAGQVHGTRVPGTGTAQGRGRGMVGMVGMEAPSLP